MRTVHARSHDTSDTNERATYCIIQELELLPVYGGTAVKDSNSTSKGSDQLTEMGSITSIALNRRVYCMLAMLPF